MTTHTVLVPAAHLRGLFDGAQEFAVLDVRDPHEDLIDQALLRSTPLPMSDLRAGVTRLVPRPATPIVLIGEESSSQAGAAAKELVELGYSDVAILDGGIQAWRADGGHTHVPGAEVMAFAEMARRRLNVPLISATKLDALRRTGKDIVVFDNRPLEEHNERTIPGSIQLAGAELARLAHRWIDSPETVVVVHCAARTRGLIGAQTLRDAGLPNPVYALDGGLMAWVLAGLPLAAGHGQSPPADRPGSPASAAASGVQPPDSVARLDGADVERLRRDPHRTTYLLDVRTPDEFARAHVPGARSAPSWDVAPQLYRYVGTHNARIVLLDGPDLVRAGLVATWLVRMGEREVFIHATDPTDTVHLVTSEAGPPGPTSARPQVPRPGPWDPTTSTVQRQQAFRTFLDSINHMVEGVELDPTNRIAL